ncbi:uncharacterized protein AB675_719 [Cyphellophora attinorum]|uniref:Uncharacterized protein n=1 Tax=Cyphellophora attinorum TaxID=1664694 RepID=A0A0N1P275_9EURO|nr:uncharacterized protein AB675_719 [Phialophora attinorum]KPI45386.1 hypothetical protein AB675_719 [Phialophora attinorum]
MELKKLLLGSILLFGAADALPKRKDGSNQSIYLRLYSNNLSSYLLVNYDNQCYGYVDIDLNRHCDHDYNGKYDLFDKQLPKRDDFNRHSLNFDSVNELSKRDDLDRHSHNEPDILDKHSKAYDNLHKHSKAYDIILDWHSHNEPIILDKLSKRDSLNRHIFNELDVIDQLPKRDNFDRHSVNKHSKRYDLDFDWHSNNEPLDQL